MRTRHVDFTRAVISLSRFVADECPDFSAELRGLNAIHDQNSEVLLDRLSKLAPALLKALRAQVDGRGTSSIHQSYYGTMTPKELCAFLESIRKTPSNPSPIVGGDSISFAS